MAALLARQNVGQDELAARLWPARLARSMAALKPQKYFVEMSAERAAHLRVPAHQRGQGPPACGEAHGLDDGPDEDLVVHHGVVGEHGAGARLERTVREVEVLGGRRRDALVEATQRIGSPEAARRYYGSNRQQQILGDVRLHEPARQSHRLGRDGE